MDANLPNTRPTAHTSATDEHTTTDAQGFKFTGYRILVFVLTAGFGLSKARLSYQGYSTAPNTLDWLYGVVAFLTLYWLGIYEKHTYHNRHWFFDIDYVAVLWGFVTGKAKSPRRMNSLGQRID